MLNNICAMDSFETSLFYFGILLSTVNLVIFFSIVWDQFHTKNFSGRDQ